MRLAVDGGYDKAILTIVDSHVTTLIRGVALFLSVRGDQRICRDLMSRNRINLFTALIGTKVIFDLLNQRHKVEQLSI